MENYRTCNKQNENSWRRREWMRKILEARTEDFQKLMSNTNPQIQKIQKISKG